VFHDKSILRKSLTRGQKVLLYNSRLPLSWKVEIQMYRTIQCVSCISAQGSSGWRSQRRSNFQGEWTTIETVFGI